MYCNLVVKTFLVEFPTQSPNSNPPLLTISVDVAAFDGRPTASASSQSARLTTTVARGTPGLSGTHRGREGRVGHAGGAQQRRTTTSFHPSWVEFGLSIDFSSEKQFYDETAISI